MTDLLHKIRNIISPEQILKNLYLRISDQNILKKLAHQKIRAYLFNDMRVCKVERIIIPQMKRSSVRRYLIACWSCAVAAV